MEQQKQLTLRKHRHTYKLVIPEDVERKIRHLCEKVSEVEWSGTLFYTHEGSMETEDLVITCKDIYVMDIGSSTYTEFDTSPDVVSYMVENPELLDMHMGLIHSHNRMSTFFSSTDTATLSKLGSYMNHFVSLIVNNEGTYTAAITRKVKCTETVSRVYDYNSFGDTPVVGADKFQKEIEEIEYFMLDIIKEGCNYSFKAIDDRLSEIRKRKASVPKPKITATTQKPLKSVPSLFDNFPEKAPSKLEKVDINDSPEETIKYSDVRNTVIQMLTGSIIIADPSKIDLEEWAAKMPEIYEKRFGVGEIGFKAFESWAEAYCEFLIFDKEPEVEDIGGENLWISGFASALSNELDSLPRNMYIDTFKEFVEQWIV